MLKGATPSSFAETFGLLPESKSMDEAATQDQQLVAIDKGEIVEISDDEGEESKKSPLSTNVLECAHTNAERSEGSNPRAEDKVQTNECESQTDSNENELLAEIRRLKTSNKLLREMYCEMAENVQKVSKVLKTGKLDKECGLILAQVEGIKKIDPQEKIQDPGEWAEIVNKFLIMTKHNNLDCREVTSWMINLLKIVNKSSNEAYTASWAKCAEELLKNSWEERRYSGENENNKIKKWLQAVVKAIEKLQFGIKRFRLIDSNPSASSNLGQSTIAQALKAICKAEKIVTEDIGGKMRELGKLLCFVEELRIEFGGRIDGQEDVDIKEFINGIEGILTEDKLASRFRVRKE